MELKLQEFKHQVETNKVENNLHILEYADNPFLIDLYLKEISAKKEKDIVYISTLSEVPTGNDIFSSPTKSMYVINIDKFEIDKENYTPYKNTFIVTPSTKVKTKGAIGYTIIKFPKLVDWQTKSYIKTIAEGIKDRQLDWLYDVTQGDIYRLYNEAMKLSLFDTKDQEKMFNLISDGGGYDDLSSYTIYSLGNSITKREIETARNVLSEIDNIDIDGIGLLALLYKTFRNIINIQLDPKATAQSLGMSDAQFRAVNYTKGKYKNSELINIFKFITELDRQIKFGEITLRGNKLIDYIVCNILST